MTNTHGTDFSPQRVLVVGASGGTGRATVERLLEQGNEVTAFSRRASSLPRAKRLRTLDGDASDPQALLDAVAGQDAVIVTLGIARNPFWVLLGSAGTHPQIRSVGTRNVIDAMKVHGVRRLVVQTSYGVGESRSRLRWVERLFFAALLRPQIQDTERQEQLVRQSGLDWVIAQPVHLTDAVCDQPCFASAEYETQKMSISRSQVARFLAEATRTTEHLRQPIALSAV